MHWKKDSVIVQRNFYKVKQRTNRITSCVSTGCRPTRLRCNCRKGPGDTVDNHLNMSQQYALATTRDHSCSKGNASSIERNISHHKGGQTLEQKTQKGCGITILEAIQNKTEHSPEENMNFSRLWTRKLQRSLVKELLYGTTKKVKY